MSAFLYFVENWRKPPKAEDLQSLGLAHAFDGLPPYHGDANQSPPGCTERGYLLCDDRRLDPFNKSVRPDDQTWRRRPSADGDRVVWVGWYNEAMPAEANLQRDRQIGGERVRLAGADWQVPLIGHPKPDGSIEPRLPRKLDVDGDGKFIRGDVADEHRWLIDVVTPFWSAWSDQYQETLAGGGEQWSYSYDLDTHARMAASVLRANYRIDWFEAAILGLFMVDAGEDQADRGPFDVLGAACGCRMAEVLVGKKKAHDPETR